MKVTITSAAADGFIDMSIKIKLPKKWDNEGVSNLIQTFVESYNKKHADASIAAESVHLMVGDKTLVPGDIVAAVVQDGQTLLVKPGAPPAREPVTAVPPPAAPTPTPTPGGVAAAGGTAADSKDDGKLFCNNYGCRQRFVEAANHDSACRHHTKPPLFHETRKGWSCCPDTLAYDWDGFMAIPGCVVSRHSTTRPDQVFAASPTIVAAEEAAAAAAAAAAAPKLKDINEYCATQPNAPEAHLSAVATLTRKPVVAARTDGKAKCIHKGCQQEYVVADNDASACRHHPGQAVFHDGSKYWSCCPDKKAYDWEGFMAIAGCTVAAHSDGSDTA